MSEKITPRQKNTILVNGIKTTCEGPKNGKHPKVYLKLENGQVTCPYCGNDFRQSNRVDKN